MSRNQNSGLALGLGGGRGDPGGLPSSSSALSESSLMDKQTRINKAIEFAQMAADHDREGRWDTAIQLYSASLEYWRLVLKYETNEVFKARIAEKATEYIERAEYLKDQLKKGNTPQAPGTGGAGGGRGGVGSGGGGRAASHSRSGSGGSGDDDRDKATGANFDSAIVTTKPDVPWSAVAGLEKAKCLLQEAVILPVKYPSLFRGERKPWRGILLYGPPGTGKTHLAKACATEADATFISVSSSDLMSKWQGESEKLVKALFDTARKKRPSIIFIDEIDSMCSARNEHESESSRRVKTEFLVQMDGIIRAAGGGEEADVGNVLVLGATNLPWGLDLGIRRRFERRIYVPMPDANARKELLRLAVGSTPHTLRESDFEALANATQGYSGSDISIVVRDSLMEPVRKCRTSQYFKMTKSGKFTPCGNCDVGAVRKRLSEIPDNKLQAPPATFQDFQRAIKDFRPSVSDEDLKRYVEWTNSFGADGS